MDAFLQHMFEWAINVQTFYSMPAGLLAYGPVVTPSIGFLVVTVPAFVFVRTVTNLLKKAPVSYYVFDLLYYVAILCVILPIYSLNPAPLALNWKQFHSLFSIVAPLFYLIGATVAGTTYLIYRNKLDKEAHAYRLSLDAIGYAILTVLSIFLGVYAVIVFPFAMTVFFIARPIIYRLTSLSEMDLS